MCKRKLLGMRSMKPCKRSRRGAENIGKLGLFMWSSGNRSVLSTERNKPKKLLGTAQAR
jgi:hypothetical protein